MKNKNILVIILAVVLIFIPTYAAVGFYISVRNAPVTRSSVAKMVLTDLDGSEYSFEKNATEEKNFIDGEDPIDFFIRLNENSDKVASMPEPLIGGDCYTVTYYSYDLTPVYKYYFTDTADDAYYTDGERAYKVKTADASAFISSQYATALYEGAETPVMYIANEANVIKPTSMDWYYKLSNGQFAAAVVPLADSRGTYKLAGTLNLGFTGSTPDSMFVRIYNGENLVYNDLYSNISTFKFDENASLVVAVSCEWFEDAARDNYGRAEYTFVAEVRAPAEFFLGEASVLPGEFVVITGKNVTDPASIEFKSEPDISFTPTFYRDGEYVLALVPISYDLDYSPTYKFTVTADDTTTELTLGCEAKKFADREYNISAEIVATTRTKTTVEAFNTAMQPFWDNKLETRYWESDTAFSMPVTSNNSTVKAGIGIRRTIVANGDTYRHPGVDFMIDAADPNASVFAMCGGEVIYSGTQTLSGRVVVIDHGFGLKTLYAHLSSITVNVGDKVAQGDVIGVVGSTGFTYGISLHVGMYVGNVPVSPYDAWAWDGATGIMVSRP